MKSLVATSTVKVYSSVSVFVKFFLSPFSSILFFPFGVSVDLLFGIDEFGIVTAPEAPSYQESSLYGTTGKTDGFLSPDGSGSQGKFC